MKKIIILILFVPLLSIGQSKNKSVITNLHQTYSGLPISVKTNRKVDKITYDGNVNAPVNAGTYIVVAEYRKHNKVKTDTQTLIVDKYISPGYVPPPPINAGTYAITASLIDNSKLTFWDKYYPLITGGIFLLILTIIRIIIFIQDLKNKKNEDDDSMGIDYDPIK